MLNIFVLIFNAIKPTITINQSVTNLVMITVVEAVAKSTLLLKSKNSIPPF